MNTRFLKYMLLLVEFTSIPLLALCTVYLLTGYQILLPHLRVIPNASSIHVDKVLRALFVTFCLVHGYAGTIILINRRTRSRARVKALELLVSALIAVLAAFLVYLELLVS